MHQFPKHLNTAQDYENCEQLFAEGKLPAERLAEAYEALLNLSKQYVYDKHLKDEKDRTGPEPEYRVMPDEDGGFTQFKLVDNPNSPIIRHDLKISDIESKTVTLRDEGATKK
jgi:hypothetical protein